MKILLENVNLNSTNGPNSFANKIIPHIQTLGHTFVPASDADISLCFIESYNDLSIPRVLRLDGIYFNTTQDYQSQNQNIKRTFDSSKGIVYQSNFNKKLIETYFGSHLLSVVIHNGADLGLINSVKPMSAKKTGEIWCCASKWRPHKRLRENIRYFLEHKGKDDLLIVAGDTPEEEKIKDTSIAYFGELSQMQLYSVYRAAKYFIHLAWLDHCPNVVVDARSADCHIICSSSGGTKEISGLDSTIIKEEEWDFQPLDLYDPPKLDFDKKINNTYDTVYNIADIAKQYTNFMELSL